jgi:hypothetical protein
VCSSDLPSEASLSSINDSDGGILGYMTIIHHTEQDRQKQVVKNGFSQKASVKK